MFSIVFLYASKQKPAATLSHATAVVSKPMCAAFLKPAELGAVEGAGVSEGATTVVVWLLAAEGMPETEERGCSVTAELLEKEVADCAELVRDAWFSLVFRKV